jgi:CelD/BcsL family acetyltransferase involved in cellulose biosynthesis
MARVPGSTAIASDRLAIRVLPGTALAEAQAHWTALERALGGAPALSCSWAWTETWLQHYADVVEPRFLVGEADGEPRAIALVTRAPGGPLRPRTLHLGTAGEPRGSSVFVERNRLLVAPAERAAFATALMDALAAEGGWDRLRLDGLHPEDAAALLAGAGSGLPATIEEQECPVADLRAGDDVLDALSSSRRQRIRRTLKAFGALEVDWARDAEEAQAILDELIALHQERWREAGAPGAFASERFTAFHRALVARLAVEQRAALVRVRRGEEVVGCLYGLVEGERLLFYQSGLRRYEDNRLRAGVAAHVCFMRACRDRGLGLYDFLAPATRYKQELASGSERLAWAELARPSWRMQLSSAARRVRSRR